MNTRTHTHKRLHPFNPAGGKKSFLRFLGVVVAVVLAVWILDMMFSPVATEDNIALAAPEDNSEVVGFAVDAITSLSVYYDSIGNISNDTEDKVELFASVVYKRGVLSKLNEHMALYLASENPDIVEVAERIVTSGEALEYSYDRIIEAMKNEAEVDQTLVVVEEIYFINENLFNITVTTVNAVQYFIGVDAPPERNVLTEEERTYLTNHIWETFGPLSTDVASTTSSRQLIYSAFSRGQ